jgi:anti-anti-sigma factor
MGTPLDERRKEAAVSAEQSTPRAGHSAFSVFPDSWKSNLRGDLAGGLVAAVVTIPMSIGFGLLAFAPFGERFLSIGILSGLYGAIFLGVVALLLGARTVTIYAPRSLIAFMIGSIAMQGFAQPPAGPLGQLEPYYLAGALLATLSLAGLIQMIFGAVRLGALVRFIPSPVMAGFQNAAALLILYSQLHIMLGLPHRLPPSALYAALADAKLLNLALGAATVAVIWIGGRLSPRLPPALLGLLFGTLAYYLLAAAGLEAKLGPTLGPISGGSPDGYYFGAMLAFAVHRAAIDMLPTLLLFAFSLAVVASLDTLICSRIVEGMTGQRIAANRVLRLIGGANLITPLLGGICGGISVSASTAGYKGGARTSLALLVHSAVIFTVVATLAPLLAKLPLVVVGAVLVVTAVQLVDRWSLQLVRKVISRDTADWHSTAVDLAVILAVAVTAIAGDIAIAVLIGVGVAVVLFVLRMSRSIVRRELYGDEMRSRRARGAAESALLNAHGRGIVLLELEGPVFFGSAESLAERVDAALASGVRYVVLDFRRVNDLDSTGARILLQTHERLKAQGVHLLLASVDAAPHVEVALHGMGVVAAVGAVFADADHALEWAENHLVGTLRPAEPAGGEYPFEQLGLLARFTAKEREQLRALLKRREYAAGEILFREGAAGDELYIIVSGSASAKLTVAGGGQEKRVREQRLVSFAAGTHVGEMALLDREARSATVQADERLVCYVLDRPAYEHLERDMPAIAIKLLTNLGAELSSRLRLSNRMLS